MNSIQVLTRETYQKSIWKNGLGFTEQIAIHPSSADLRRSDFLWRLSSARIEKDSPFSVFAEHDRVLLILEGDGVRITHKFSPEQEGENQDVLPFEPYEFPGDISTDCVLLNGPVKDLSLFLRKGAIESSVEVRELADEEDMAWIPSGRWNFAFAAGVPIHVHGSASEDPLLVRAGDTLIVDGDTRIHDFPEKLVFRRKAAGPGKLVLISLYEV